MVIDYIKIDQEFDYYNQDVFQTNVKSSSNLTFFEYYQPTSKKRLGVQFRRGKSDWQKLNQIGYNEKFWSENPIVKRTPSEEKIITSFEVDNAFENIFLNSKERIAQQLDASMVSRGLITITTKDGKTPDTILKKVNNQTIPLRQVCKQIQQMMDHASRLQLMHFLFSVIPQCPVEELEKKLIEKHGKQVKIEYIPKTVKGGYKTTVIAPIIINRNVLIIVR